MNLIDHLNWRYATKMFDPQKKISKQDLEFLKEAIRLSVSSYGLQLYKVLIIENDEIRAALRKASWDQSQITDASQLFVFCNYTLDYDRHVDDYVERIITIQGNFSNGIKQYGESIKTSIGKMSAEERKSWSEKQTYLALNNLLIACAELKIDACPMEGFDNHAYNQILGLDEQGLNAVVIAPVGYRSVSDKTQNRLKVRKTKEELFQIA
ncbi:NAD(P)H-dependent oxidoreductase [Arenibacter sp. M-2]|uniref:NAD(P)H-dependent oxidoreductase n=1 Tax=Arenibacter sp. M-2 TaxID=3053612 RepID=UPI0025704FAA|nr:NAD(P)H-dependent oxidoreductase [Arenibacter sp. M-2]MDL5512229.1 NAD(P)H-dependent oxidoreductase [Arenibacter sp. M-2]|tara:strand:+ start:32539 stop:33168 length:630 start_codon:yes stop_codon:yes gene_type:complete